MQLPASNGHKMIERLMVLAEYLEGKHSDATADMALTASEVSMLAKGIQLLAAVRIAIK